MKNKYNVLLFVIALIISTTQLSASSVDNGMHPLQMPYAGKIIRHYLQSPQLGEEVAVDIWLPEGYDETEAGYPVIYMHDGQNLYDANTTWNHQAWNIDSVATSLIRQGIINPPITVGIHNESKSRTATLMPVKGVEGLKISKKEFSDRLHGVEMRGDEYVEFMANTLKPMVDSLYRTLPTKKDTYVAGSSMGGLMSIYALCERSDIFGNAICMSTHWSGFPGHSDDFAAGMCEYIRTKLPDVSKAFSAGYVPRLYFDHGTTTIDADYGIYEDKIKEMLLDKGYGPEYLMMYVAEGAPHNEVAWNARLYLPLIFMLHK